MTHKCKHTTVLFPVKHFGFNFWRAGCNWCELRGKLRWSLNAALDDCDVMEASDDEQ